MDCRRDGSRPWHYTDLRNLLKKVPEGTGQADVSTVAPLVEGSQILSVVDGKALDGDVPHGLKLGFYRDALSEGIAAQRMVLQNSDDLIGRLNGALVNDGLSLSVEPDTELSSPLEIQVIQGGGQSHSRFPVTIEKGVKGTFVERHVTHGGENSLVSSITDLVVGDDADIVWVISQERGLSDTHLGQINIKLGKNSKLTLFVANAGGKLVATGAQYRGQRRKFGTACSRGQSSWRREPHWM